MGAPHTDAAAMPFQNARDKQPFQPPHVLGCLCQHPSVNEKNSHAPLSTQACSHEPLLLQKHSLCMEVKAGKEEKFV